MKYYPVVCPMYLVAASYPDDLAGRHGIIIKALYASSQGSFRKHAADIEFQGYVKDMLLIYRLRLTHELDWHGRLHL